MNTRLRRQLARRKRAVENRLEKTKFPVQSPVIAASNVHKQAVVEIQQLKSGVRALTAPVDTFAGNWAYMVMPSLAWTLKIWAALMVPEDRRSSSEPRRRK